MTESLRVFISSREKELSYERLMVIRTIKSLLLTPISSEDRSATFVSMEEMNQKEVRSSHIYIGIFGRCYSDPIIREFYLARQNGKQTLIFKKNVGDLKRDPDLQNFLDTIQHSRKGLVTEYFSDIFDLRKKVKKAIIGLMSERYLSYTSIDIENLSSEYSQLIDMENIPKRIEIRPLSIEELIKFKFNLPSKFKDSISIQEVSISQLNKYNDTNITVYLHGTISKGFISLFIRDSDNNDFWFPDKSHWNIVNDEGELSLSKTYELCKWSFKVPDYAKEPFRIFVLIFEDSDGNTQDKRKVVTGVELCIHRDIPAPNGPN